METKKFTDFTENFMCISCDIKCSRQAEWNRHIATAKHKRKESGKNLEGNFTTGKIYECSCGKIYKTHSGLWKHKKNCNPPILNEPSANEVKFLTNLVMEIVKNNNDLQKQNYELQKQVLDVCKTATTNSTYISQNQEKYDDTVEPKTSILHEYRASAE